MSRDPSSPLRFLPVALDLRGKECLVVGGGRVGTRKAITLANAGAAVTVVSPAVTTELAEMIDAGRIRWVKGPFRRKHMSHVWLVVAATDDDALNAAVVQAAAQCGALVSDASSAERSQVIFGALLESEDAIIAVFTGGRDPAHARRTRDRIADLIGGRPSSEAER